VLIHRDEAPYLRQGGMHARLNRDLYVQLFLHHGTPQALLDWFVAANDAGWARDWRTEPRIFDSPPGYRVRTELIGEVHAPDERADRWEEAITEPDTLFDDGDLLEFGAVSLQAIHTPGHTPGHCSFYHQESGALFTGDHVLKRITPNPGLFFLDNDPAQRTRSVPSFMASLDRLRTVPARRVFGAHEGPMDDLAAALDRLARHHEERASQALRALHGGRDTSFGVMPFLFPNLRRNGLFAAMGETIGHMDLLEDRGQAAASDDGELIRYHLTA
jgi:glyoxylase-like metal-dependent hydrolase (beta-lactamase superfamily II)